MSSANGPLGEIATEVLFENEKVRVWNLLWNRAKQATGTCTKMTT